MEFSRYFVLLQYPIATSSFKRIIIVLSIGPAYLFDSDRLESIRIDSRPLPIKSIRIHLIDSQVQNFSDSY